LAAAPLAHSLKMSQSEVSQSVARSKYAGLLDDSGKRVMRQALIDFLQYGLAVVFPAKPGAIVRGMPTAHSAPPLNLVISSGENYVWPFAMGDIRGHGITLYIPPYHKLFWMTIDCMSCFHWLTHCE
jgi:hypothetical protein